MEHDTAWRMNWTIILLSLLAGLAVAKHAYVFDELAWTKQSWSDMKLRFPIETVLDEDDFGSYEHLSSKGTHSKASYQQALEDGMSHSSISPALQASIIDEAALAMVSSLVACKVCHELLAKAWEQAQSFVHSGYGIPTKQHMLRMLRHSCEFQVAKNMAQQWAIFKVGAAELVPGQSDAWAYVLKGRASADEAPSEFEQLAMQRSCSLVLEGQMDEGDEHADLFAALMVTSLQLYEKEWDAIREEAGLMRVNGGGFTAHLGKPDGVSCKDYHSECSHWADKGECWKNPDYMVGDAHQRPARGYCRLSCGTCLPIDGMPDMPEEVALKVEAVGMARLQDMTQALCLNTEACKGISGDAYRAMSSAEASAGASAGAVAGQPPAPAAPALERGGAEGDNAKSARKLVQAFPRPAPNGQEKPLPRQLVQDAGLGRKELVRDCFYSLQGWWSYELCPGRQLRQFHLEDGNRPNPIINLGRYDSQASQEGREGEDSDAELPPEQLLPGMQHLSVAFRETVYTGGDKCEGPHGEIERQVQVRFACSPDKDIYLVIQEPETCRYISVLYHPAVCLVKGMEWRVSIGHEEDSDSEMYYLGQDYHEDL